MKLSKSQKVVLDFCINHPCNLQNRFHTIEHLSAGIPDMSYDSVYETCESLAEKSLLLWGDKQHTAVRLTGDGRDYREIDHLEKKEIWLNRLWGFLVGVATSVTVTVILSVLPI